MDVFVFIYFIFLKFDFKVFPSVFLPVRIIYRFKNMPQFRSDKFLYFQTEYSSFNGGLFLVIP